jgi:hypothetical protein
LAREDGFLTNGLGDIGIDFSSNLFSSSEVLDVFNSNIVDGPTAVAFTFNVLNSFVNPTSKLLQVNNAGVEKFSIGPKGEINGILVSASASIPVSGTHTQGEVIFNHLPIAGGTMGWVCVASGTPGTWKQWGLISA